MSDLSPPLDLERARNLVTSLAVLSLDLTRGTLRPMGLDVADEAAFREALRAESLAPAATERDVPRVAQVLARLAERFGAAFRDELVTWIEATFLGPADPALFHWRVLVAQGTTTSAPPLVARVREELARDRSERLPEEPQSAHDVKLLGLYGFPTLSVRGEMEATPMTLVQGLVDDQAFLAAWRRALAKMPFPDDAVNEAYAWGKHETAHISLKDLPRPDGLGRAKAP